MSRPVRIALLAMFLALPIAACGDGGGSGDDTTVPDADPNAPDADPNAPPDADPTAPDANTTGCGTTECSDCIDNDNDGTIDGFDIECTGAIDDDESSFATGIPGDNMDTVNQDCFFDGDSGAGNDGCNRHVCCILGLTTQECQAGGYDNNYDPVADCPAQDPNCIDACGVLPPPGCDCFGCCTVCDDAGCVDIYLNPAIAPECDETVIHDSNLCPTCVQSTDCGPSSCDDDPTDCILCPGQDESDLPPECTTNECPTGQTVCTTTADCPSTEYCSNGCCIPEVIVN